MAPSEPLENAARFVYVSRARLHRPRANVIQTIKTAEGLARIGVSVALFVPPWKGTRSKDEILNDMGVGVALGIRADSGLRSFWKPMAFAPFFWRHKKRLQNAPVVYTRSAVLSLALMKHGIPHSFEVHDMDALQRQNVLQRLMEGYTKGLIRRFFPISQAAAQGFLDLGVPPERVHVCPCGVDLGLFENIAPWDPSGLKRPHIMYVGRISRHRGLSLLERLAVQETFRVTVVGSLEDSPETERIGVIPFVPHHQIPRYLEQADILVMPYQRNLPHAGSISPMKLFEAMAAGRPILVSDLEPIREIARHGRNALCVDPDDEEAWLEAVRFLQEHPGFARELAARAQKDAARYSWENRARILRDTLLAEKPEHAHG
ncbi:glycosyltransferase [Desulfosoma sp.]